MSDPISVCMPVCSKDVLLCYKNIAWQVELETHWGHCVISHDASISNGWVKILVEAAKKCYETVDVFEYPNPQRGYWPPNQAWQHSARRMQQTGRAWLWMEADMIPLRRGWLQAVNTAYHDCGKPFFGPVVKGMGHANGTMCYPANTPDIIPRTMSEVKGAWDVVCKAEMIHLNCDAGEIIQIAWSMVNNRLHQYAHGEKPTFQDHESLKMLLPSAVLFHRNPSGDLIQRLRERMKI